MNEETAQELLRTLREHALVTALAGLDDATLRGNAARLAYARAVGDEELYEVIMTRLREYEIKNPGHPSFRWLR